MPSPDLPQDDPRDAVRITNALPDAVVADHKRIRWMATVHLFDFLEGHGNNPDSKTLADLRKTFLDGSAMSRAAADRAAAPTPIQVIDVLHHPIDNERVYKLADGITSAEVEAVLKAIAAELGIFTYTTDEIDNLNDLLSCLHTVCDELASRVHKHSRPLTSDEWTGLDRFYQHGLKLVDAHEAAAPTDTTNSEDGDEPGG